MRLRIYRPGGGEAGPLFGQELKADLFRNVTCDLPLQRDDVAHFARVLGTPQVSVTVSIDQLGDKSVETTAEQELTVIGNLLDAVDDADGLGLQAGARYHLTTYGIWGFTLISSPTLRSAIDVGLHYLDLTFTFTRIDMHDSDGEM